MSIEAIVSPYSQQDARAALYYAIRALKQSEFRGPGEKDVTVDIDSPSASTIEAYRKILEFVEADCAKSIYDMARHERAKYSSQISGFVDRMNQQTRSEADLGLTLLRNLKPQPID